MSDAEKIDKLIKNNLKTSASPQLDRRIDDLIMQAETKQTQTPNIWRIIMQSKTTRYAAAAVLIVSVLASITLLDKTVPTAYAFEQTVAAMKKLTTVHMHCRDFYDAEYEMWIQLDPKTGIPEYCRAYWPKTKILNISTPVKSYQYREKNNYVQVNSGKLYSIGVAPAKIFEQLVMGVKSKYPGLKVTIDDDYISETGEKLIWAFSETPNEAWEILIDPETKLPVEIHCLKQDHKMGALFKDIDKIEFNVELPKDIFKFEIPEGARISDHDHNNRVLNDPQYGMDTKGMSEKTAYKKISTDYWKALISGDTDAAKKIAPVCPQMAKGSLLDELVEVGDPYVEPGCGLGKLVPCKLKYKDGSLQRWNLIIRSRNIDGKKSIVIGSYYGSPTVVLSVAASDPDNGIDAEGLTDGQAAVEITTKFWKAYIDDNWDTLARLMPVLNAEQWQEKYKDRQSKAVEILEIGQPLRKDDCTVGAIYPDRTEYSDDEPWYPYMPVVPCKIKYSDGKVKEYSIIVKIRNINAKKSCVTIGVYGGKKNTEQ